MNRRQFALSGVYLAAMTSVSDAFASSISEGLSSSQEKDSTTGGSTQQKILVKQVGTALPLSSSSRGTRQAFTFSPNPWDLYGEGLQQVVVNDLSVTLITDSKESKVARVEVTCSIKGNGWHTDVLCSRPGILVTFTDKNSTPIVSKLHAAVFDMTVIGYGQASFFWPKDFDVDVTSLKNVAGCFVEMGGGTFTKDRTYKCG